MRYDCVLFDLDGTLTDPGVGITNSVMYALNHFGITVEDRSELHPFVGPPLADSFARYFGFSEADALTAVGYYREYFTDIGIFENAVYPGIEEMLRRLKAAGATLVVATSKPEMYARRIIDHFGLSGSFAFVAGSNLDGTRSRKDEVIRYALSNSGAPDPSRAVMVGDREHDILGAKAAGVASVGVLYGYGARDEIERAGADHIAEAVTGLEALLLRS